MRFYVTVVLLQLGGLVSAVRVARQVTVPGSVLSTVSTPTASTPTPTPVISFNPIESMTACSAGTITWTFSGPFEPLSLEVTNLNVPQSSPSSPSFTGPVTLIGRDAQLERRQSAGLISQTLGSDLNPEAQNYVWEPVDVPQGYYVIEASVGGSTAQSLEFVVTNGSDTSCLTGSSSSSTSSSPSPTVSSSSSSSPTLIAGSGSVHTTHVGAIVGGVIGGLAGAILLIAALIFCARRRRQPSRLSRHEAATFYANLKPTPGDGSSTNPFGHAHHATSGSLAGIVSNNDHDTLGPTPGASDEDFNSLSEEKAVVPPPMGHIAALPYSSNPRRTSASSSFNYNTRMPGAAANSTTTVDTQSRRRSSVDGPTYMRNNRSSTSAGVGGEGEMIPMARSGSGSQRRTARKAVPKYDLNELDNSPADTPVSASSGSNPFADAVPELSHKSSFGPGDGRPVHYLMPDLPPPAAR